MGEAYRTIGDRTMGLEGRYVLADEQGPFGSPITDSVRTSVTHATRAVAAIIYAPVDIEGARLEAHAHTMVSRIVESCGGEPVDVRVTQ